MSDWHVESERTEHRHGLDYLIQRVYDEHMDPDDAGDGEFVTSSADDTIPVPEDLQRQIASHTDTSMDRWQFYRNQHLPAEDGERLQYAREDLQRLANYYLDQWHYLGVVVTGFLPRPGRSHGVELGRSSVWGIESDSDDSCFREFEEEEIAEAEADARKTLVEIKAIHLPHKTPKPKPRARRRAA